jgi:hypothetical protein
MFQSKAIRVITGAAVSLAALYAILQIVLGLDDFIILLNGAFVGAGITYIIAFSDILRDAVTGKGPYDRVRQMALGMIIVWCALVVGIIASVYGRASGRYMSYSELTPMSRYLAIVGGIVQITAPDIGQGLFYGRDRRLLIFALGVGIIVALVLILVQT